MPKGLYSLRDRGSGTQLAYERFWCAVGPIGWRYAAEVLAPDGRTGGGLVDLTVDDRWRQLRVEVRSGGWQVRGGVAGTEAVWVRAHASGEQARESAAVAAGFTGRSPGFLVAVARMLGLAPGRGYGWWRWALALALRTVEIVWAPVSVEEQPTKAGLLPVERYETTDPVSGRLAVVHLAGDLVLSAPWSSLRGSTDRLRCAEHGRAAATSVDRWVDHGGYAQCCDPAVGVPAPAGSGG